ncbi:MAG: flagellar motor protein MotB [Synergistales bacterium]
MARSRRKPSEEPRAGNWLTTYGDMVTLILTFFVLLYSFSTIDIMKFEKMLMSFRGAVGLIEGGKSYQPEDQSFSGSRMEDAGESRRPTKDFLKVAERLRTLVREKGLEREIQVVVEKRGIVVSISESLLFGSGQYELSPRGKPFLSALAELLKTFPEGLSAEGHTDNQPLSRGGFVRDNWALSSLRASGLIAFLEESGGVSARRMQAVGYGPSRPIMPNDTPEHRQMNRRVDLVVLSED